MLTLPDFKEKQILFVRSELGQPGKLRFYNDNIVFERDDKVVNRASCHKVFAVFVMGDLVITTNLLREAKRRGVTLFFLKYNFEIFTSVAAQAEGNYFLRHKQYTMTEAERLATAKEIVKNKIANQAALLNQEGLIMEDLRLYKKPLFEAVDAVKDRQALLGLEGNHTKQFFSQYFAPIGWLRRAPRIKQDIPNFLMDMGYTWMFNITDALLRLHGFDTYRGVYHTLFFQRRSLACDLVEPLRSVIEKQILKAYRLGQIKDEDFEVHKGQVTLPFKNNEKYARIFFEAIMERKEDIYEYVHGYYRHVMNPEENPMPVFSL